MGQRCPNVSLPLFPENTLFFNMVDMEECVKEVVSDFKISKK